eukprot:g34633.t1
MILKFLYTKLLDCKTFKQNIASLQADTQSVPTFCRVRIVLLCQHPSDHLFLVCSCFYYQQFGVCCRHCFAIKSGKLDVFADIHFRWFLGYSDPTHAISALKSSRSFDDAATNGPATNGPGICGADPDHITTAFSSLRKASECVDAWLRGKLDIIPLSIPLWSKYVLAQEYEDVNADFDADHSDAAQDRETCQYDFSNSSASTSSLKLNCSHYKAFCDERIKEQAGKASRARNQEELQSAIALAAQAHDWLDQELERKFSDSTATESSNQSSERDCNVPRKGGSSKRFVPVGNGTNPQHPRKVILTKDKQLRNENKALQAKKKNVSKMC